LRQLLCGFSTDSIYFCTEHSANQREIKIILIESQYLHPVDVRAIRGLFMRLATQSTTNTGKMPANFGYDLNIAL
jgi:hypothetical protein